MKSAVLALAILALPSLCLAQTPIRNPSAISFTCPDHGSDDQHEADIVAVSDGKVVATLLLGDPAPSITGIVIAPLNVQPVAFGQYRVVLRAVVGAQKSANSEPSDIFERVPGSPSKGVLK